MTQIDAEQNWAIETIDLTRKFGEKVAVDSVNLQVERGTLYGFLGHNGAGKSTTIKMLTGLLAPSGGEMRVLGFDMRNEQQSLQAKKRIGVIPENLALFENLTAQEYLTFVWANPCLSLDTIENAVQSYCL